MRRRCWGQNILVHRSVLPYPFLRQFAWDRSRVRTYVGEAGILGRHLDGNLPGVVGSVVGAIQAMSSESSKISTFRSGYCQEKLMLGSARLRIKSPSRLPKVSRHCLFSSTLPTSSTSAGHGALPSARSITRKVHPITHEAATERVRQGSCVARSCSVSNLYKLSPAIE